MLRPKLGWVRSFHALWITAGNNAHGEHEKLYIPKRELITNAQLLFQTTGCVSPPKSPRHRH
jgi:hypothetical protein